jgi:hypothetical protein
LRSGSQPLWQSFFFFIPIPHTRDFIAALSPANAGGYPVIFYFLDAVLQRHDEGGVIPDLIGNPVFLKQKLCLSNFSQNSFEIQFIAVRETITFVLKTQF